MVAEDNVQFPEVMTYVGYLVKIATLAQSFKWEQVIKSQAELGFTWGADNSYLMQVYLKSHVQDTMHGNVGNPQSTKPSNRGTGSGPRRDL